MKQYPVIIQLNSQSRAMFGSLMALSLASLSILAGKPYTDTAISVGIFFFAVAIPCLAFCIERVRIDSQHKKRTHSIYIDLIEACGIFGTLIGFGAIFWHFSIWAAIIFIATSFFVNHFITWYEEAMEAINSEPSEERDPNQR